MSPKPPMRRAVLVSYLSDSVRLMQSFKDRFWTKVRKTDGCWIWTASLKDTGYGQFMTRVDNRNVLRYAHRIAYELVKGSIPEGLHLDHLCTNRACVNPDHLEVVTLAENNQRTQDRKTHCPHGHPVSAYGRRDYRGHRFCAECKRLRDRRRSKTHRDGMAA